jgi:hypothetical protein
LLQHRGLRVITNNLNVAAILSDNPDCEVIVAGGVVRNAGPRHRRRDHGRLHPQFRVDIGLIGISGIEADGWRSTRARPVRAHWCSTAGPRCRDGAARVAAALSAAGPGRARRRRASGTTRWPARTRRCSGRAHGADIAAIGITNQRETVVLWDRATGQPLAPAIVWQDRRTADVCARCGRRATKARCARRPAWCSTPTSRPPSSPGCSTTCPARARAERGELAFGTIDSWLVWQLTGGRRTSPT